MAEVASSSPILEVRDLQVYYGRAHALQGVNLTLQQGVLSVVGRNGMGKTTLCNTVMGLIPARSGSIRLAGEDILGLDPNRIVRRGVGYVPQGRRVWPSLTVDEHLKVALRGAEGAWSIERIYQTFPRLAERRRNGGGQLSGGEQQMLAISRALLGNPRLLIMDEPTEGLAPVIVQQVSEMLRTLAADDDISVLLIEQNLGVATSAANRVAVMVNGRVVHELPAVELTRNVPLQQKLLGVQAQDDEIDAVAIDGAEATAAPGQVFLVRRAQHDFEQTPGQGGFSTNRAPTRWSQSTPSHGYGSQSDDHDRVRSAADTEPSIGHTPMPSMPVSSMVGRAAYVVGTFDTKGRELGFLRTCLERRGVRVVTVDLSTSRQPSPADVGPGEVARCHPKGVSAVFTGDRGSAVTAMAAAFERFVAGRRDLAGIISAGGSGGTALATPAMRALPVGVPKVMVSTVASGNVKDYVGPSDICMMYSVTDVSGINRISQRVLSNAAHALAGMISNALGEISGTRPAIGLTMFGVTTPCVQAVSRALEQQFDCLVFHATGTGGQSMEKLVDSGLLAGVIDATTTEVCDHLVGGVFSAGEDRLGAVIRTGIPYVGACGALDMVNWGARETVPERFQDRNLYIHNPQVTLMRTTVEENTRIGRWIGERLNRMPGPVRFLLPEGGVSLLDAPGQPFHDTEADAALFRSLEDTVHQSDSRQLIRLACNINDPAFADALVQQFLGVFSGSDQKGWSHATI
jgi:uncharacterized protein (UPF0261 family)/ABC-type branched-subunit amino acid transport system ATPase component